MLRNLNKILKKNLMIKARQAKNCQDVPINNMIMMIWKTDFLIKIEEIHKLMLEKVNHLPEKKLN